MEGGFFKKSRPASGKFGGEKGKGKKGKSGSMMGNSPFKTYSQSAPSTNKRVTKVSSRKR